MQIGLPITGKYRDPESDFYYNHADVRIYKHIKLMPFVSLGKLVERFGSLDNE